MITAPGGRVTADVSAHVAGPGITSPPFRKPANLAETIPISRRNPPRPAMVRAIFLTVQKRSEGDLGLLHGLQDSRPSLIVGRPGHLPAFVFSMIIAWGIALPLGIWAG